MDSSKAKLNIEEPVSVRKPSRIPVIVAVVFIVIAIALAIALVVVVTNHSKNSVSSEDSGKDTQTDEVTEEVCTTPGCVTAAGTMLEDMDQTVDPCEDFFKFSCGNWIKKNIIPEDQSSYTSFSQLRNQVSTQVKALFEEPKKSNEPSALSEVKNMYTACSDEAKIEALGYQPLTDLLDSLGGWPMINTTWDDSNFSFMELLYQLRMLNNRYFVNAYLTVDYKNSSNHILKFGEFGFGLPSREYYLDSQYDKYIEAYKVFIKEVVIFLHNGTTSTLDQDIEDIVELETFFANNTMTKAQRRDPEKTYNKLTLGQFYTNISDQFDWLTYVNKMFTHVNYTFTNDSEVVITSPKFYTVMVDKVLATPNRTLANYLLWRFTLNRISNLPKAIQDIKQKFDQALYGVKSESPRWKTCVGYTSKFMGMAAGRLFVNKHFNDQAKSSALEMISGLREAFDDLLESVPWMNDATRKVAKEKAAAINENIGYPDWINNNTRLDAEYKGLLGVLRPDEYFENHMKTLRFSVLDYIKKIHIPVKRHQWGTSPAVVNAFYEGTENQITFPAGILQPPFWQKDRPESLNYGAIGTVIGHEITHGFDDTGRKFDKDGNLKEWWDKEVIDKFDEAKKCIIDQYGGYVATQVNRTLNGENTQGENIADNGGIKQSYRAFEKLQAKKGVGQKLPGLDYSPNQLFFIGFAQMWCSTYRDNALNLAIEEGSHSPGMFRIIGTLSNFEEFSKLYSCPKGSNMNPEKKCSVW